MPLDCCGAGACCIAIPCLGGDCCGVPACLHGCLDAICGLSCLACLPGLVYGSARVHDTTRHHQQEPAAVTTPDNNDDDKVLPNAFFLSPAYYSSSSSPAKSSSSPPWNGASYMPQDLVLEIEASSCEDDDEEEHV